MKKRQYRLPPITISADDARQLSQLADSSMGRLPRASYFLASELDRAEVVSEQPAQDVVRMGSRVRYRDEWVGQVREVTLVYPQEANINLNRISVLAPVGAALIGLSRGQTIEFRTPGGETRALTVLDVSNDV
jgi:regulator of nucleoside diphosphate kinase